MSQIISVSDDVCWLCGKPFSGNEGENKTYHHALAVTLDPSKNVMLPIHEKCHNLITSEDIATLTSFAYKLQKEVNNLSKQVGILIRFLENKELMKIKVKR